MAQLRHVKGGLVIRLRPMSPFSYVGQVCDSWRRLVISESVISFGEELGYLAFGLSGGYPIEQHVLCSGTAGAVALRFDGAR